GIRHALGATRGCAQCAGQLELHVHTVVLGTDVDHQWRERMRMCVPGRGGGPHDEHCRDQHQDEGPAPHSAGSMITSYRSTNDRRAAASASRRRAAITSRSIWSRTSAKGRRLSSTRSRTRTRCSPYGETMGPCHPPGVSANTRSAKPSPNDDATWLWVRPSKLRPLMN